MSPPEGSDPGCSHEIAWPTIFFWMACLALNSIAQQSGRVLGTKYQHQAIFRSSPILCAFDAIDMLITWVAHVFPPTTPRSRIRRAASRVLLQRCADKEGQPDLQGLARLKTQSGGRWLAFLIGVIPQLIKLFASRGVVWSRVAGAMYLGSWLVFEFLVLAAQLENTALQPLEEQSEPYHHENLIRKIWAFAGMMLHAVVYSIPIKTQMDLLKGPDDFWNYYSTSTPIMLYTFALWWGAFFTADYTPNRTVFHNLIMGAAFHLSLAPVPDSGRVVYLICVLVICIVGGYIFSYFGHRWAGGFLVSIQVLNVISQPLLFYMFMYHPAGTYQPAWLRWLG